MFLIILIEDDPQIPDIIQRAAASSFPEAHFKTITSVTEAKAYFADPANPLPKLILLDVGLPDESGMKVLSSLRTEERTHMMPVIILTANGSDVVVKESYLTGANSYIVKPETFSGWKDVLSMLRTYWLNVVTLPPAL